jgi:hypothetical protein
MDFTPQSKKRMLIGLQQQTEAWGISLQESMLKEIFSPAQLKHLDKWIADQAILRSIIPRPSAAWSSSG